MSTQSYSSIGAGRRRGTAHDDIDRSMYTVGQTLASIVNDPRAPSQSGGFWGLASEATQLPPPPPLDPGTYPPVSTADLQRYMQLVHGAYDKFMKDRQSLEAFDAQHQERRASDHRTSSSSTQQQAGEPFMVAVQAVPAHFFQDGFDDAWDDFFKQFCQEQSAEELYEQIDLLNRNLDVVELQLLREVASRSSSFFQAASTLQGLQGQLAEAVGCIRGLRQELAEADSQLYTTAAAVKALQSRREHLQDTLDITKGLEEVVASQQALDVMLENQDYAGALDLLGSLKQLQQQPQLMGLQCLRHLPPRLQDVAAAVDGALASDFLGTVANSDVGRIAAQAAVDAEAHPDASISPDGTMAAAAVWRLQDPAADAAASAAADEGLQEKLLPLAVGLYRAEALKPALEQYSVNAGDEVKTAEREVVQQVLPVLLSACGAGLPPQQGGFGGAAGAGAGAGEVHAWEQLQLLHHGAFMVLLYVAARAIFSCIHHTVRVGRVLETLLASIGAPKSEYSPVLKACQVAVQVAADVGLGRWVKLLNARSTAHMRLKQYELKQILDLSEQVAEYVESVGVRPLSSFRVALQSQCKALLDAHHTRSMQQLQGLQEAEQWVAVDVPAGFQAIVDRLLLRCAEGAALLEGREVSAGSTHLHPRGLRSSSSSSGGGGSQRDRSSAGDGPPAAAAPAPAPAGAAAEEQQQPVLQLCGKSFHLVNSGLMLLKMVDEYMSLHDLMPQFGAEIVHRQLELLKLFNSQTAALVLGAGAMRTAGLRSISAKQLALSCQAIAMLSTLLQPLRAGCLALVSQPRRALLMPEYDRLLQDLTMHIDEIHSKLVDIMRDRLAAAMQALPAEVRAAAPASSSSGSTSVSAPTPTIALLTKQLATLRAVLVPLLLKEEVEFVFGAVSRSYSDALSDTFEALLSEPNSGWEPVVQVNALTMLEAFRQLPLDPARANNYSARLTTTYTKHFGLPPWDEQRLAGNKLQLQSPSSDQQQGQQQQQPGEPNQQQQQQLLQQGDPPGPGALPQDQQSLQQQQQLQQRRSGSAGVAEAVAVAAVAAAAAAAAEGVDEAAVTPVVSDAGTHAAALADDSSARSSEVAGLLGQTGLQQEQQRQPQPVQPALAHDQLPVMSKAGDMQQQSELQEQQQPVEQQGPPLVHQQEDALQLQLQQQQSNGQDEQQQLLEPLSSQQPAAMAKPPDQAADGTAAVAAAAGAAEEDPGGLQQAAARHTAAAEHPVQDLATNGQHTPELLPEVQQEQQEQPQEQQPVQQQAAQQPLQKQLVFMDAPPGMDDGQQGTAALQFMDAPPGLHDDWYGSTPGSSALHAVNGGVEGHPRAAAVHEGMGVGLAEAAGGSDRDAAAQAASAGPTAAAAAATAAVGTSPGINTAAPSPQDLLHPSSSGAGTGAGVADGVTDSVTRGVTDSVSPLDLLDAELADEGEPPSSWAGLLEPPADGSSTSSLQQGQEQQPPPAAHHQEQPPQQQEYPPPADTQPQEQPQELVQQQQQQQQPPQRSNLRQHERPIPERYDSLLRHDSGDGFDDMALEPAEGALGTARHSVDVLSAFEHPSALPAAAVSGASVTGAGQQGGAGAAAAAGGSSVGPAASSSSSSWDPLGAVMSAPDT